MNKFDKIPYNKSNKALSSLLELQDTSLGLGEQVICARPDVEQCSRVKVDFRSVPRKKFTQFSLSNPDTILNFITCFKTISCNRQVGKPKLELPVGGVFKKIKPGVRWQEMISETS